jgi:hypothetical protein
MKMGNVAKCSKCGGEVAIPGGFANRIEIPDEVKKRVFRAGLDGRGNAEREQRWRKVHDTTYESKQAAQLVTKAQLDSGLEQLRKELGGLCVDCYVRAEPWKWTGGAVLGGIRHPR